MIITTPQVKCDLCDRQAVMDDKRNAPPGWVEVSVTDLHNRNRHVIVIHLCPTHTTNLLKMLNAPSVQGFWSDVQDTRPPDAR